MRFVVNFSGGKDSTAMLLAMIERSCRIDEIVFGDNGLEYPEVYEYIRMIENHINKDITIIRAEKNFEALFYQTIEKGKRKGEIRGFPFVITPGCWISRDLKVRPMQRKRETETVVYLGITYDEKNRIQVEPIKNEIRKYPLIEWKWTSKDCLTYLKKLGLLNSLYERYERLGCWLCPKQRISSLKSLYRFYPQLWEKLKGYEKDCPHGFKPNITLAEYEYRFAMKEK